MKPDQRGQQSLVAAHSLWVGPPVATRTGALGAENCVRLSHGAAEVVQVRRSEARARRSWVKSITTPERSR